MPSSRALSCITFYDVALEAPVAVLLERNQYRIGTAPGCDIVLPWNADSFAPSDTRVLLKKRPTSELLGESWELLPAASTVPVMNGAACQHQTLLVYRDGSKCWPMDGAPEDPLVIYDGDFLELCFLSVSDGVGQVYRCHFTCPGQQATSQPPPSSSKNYDRHPDWLSLKDKFWKLIFSHLPPSEALSRVSGVCTRFWKLVKGGLPYKHLTLGFTKDPNSSVPSLEDLKWLGQTSSEQVQSLKFCRSGPTSDLQCYEYHGTDQLTYYSKYWRAIFSQDWPNLVSLTLEDSAVHGLDSLLPAFVEEGNHLFNLKILRIVCNEDFDWSNYEDVQFASLESLAIMPANNIGVQFDGQQFFTTLFPKLKHVACSLPLQYLGIFSSIQEPTKVETLMLSSFRPPEVLFEESEDGPWEPVFFSAVQAGKFNHLTSLLLELSDWDHAEIQGVCFQAVEELCLVADEFMADEPINLKQLSSCFPVLKSLVLGLGIALDWTTSSREFMGQLVSLGVSVDSHVARRIPWDKLPGLEFLSIYGEHANPTKIFSKVKAGAEKLKWLQIGAFDCEWAANDMLNESTISDVGDSSDELSLNDLAQMVSTSNIEYFEFTAPETEDFSVHELKQFFRLLLGDTTTLKVAVVNDFDLAGEPKDSAISSLHDNSNSSNSDENDGMVLPNCSQVLTKTIRAVAREQLQLVRCGGVTLYCPSNVKRCERHVVFPRGNFVKYVKFAQNRRAGDLL